VVNAVLILLLIPTFQIIVYPLLSKCVKLTPLRKMAVGGFLTGFVYVICALIQLKINTTLPPTPESGQSLVTIDNYVQGCTDIRFIGKDGANTVVDKIIASNKSETFQLKVPSQSITWDVQKGSADCKWINDHTGKLTQPTEVPPNVVGYVIFTDDVIDLTLHRTKTMKSDAGQIVYIVNVNYYINNDAPKVVLCYNANENCPRAPNEFHDFKISNRTSNYAELPIGKWYVFIGDSKKAVGDPIDMKMNGGIYSLTLVGDPNNPATPLVQQSPDNSFSILYQLPQYFVISVAEIMFSITGNEFAFSQAPISMKAIVMALWLLTISFGNLIVVIVSSSVDTTTFNMAWLFLIYAGLMFVVMIIFIFIAYRYKYVYYEAEDPDEEPKAE